MRVSPADVPAHIETFLYEHSCTEGVQGDHFMLVSPVASAPPRPLMPTSVESFQNELTANRDEK